MYVKKWKIHTIKFCFFHLIFTGYTQRRIAESQPRFCSRSHSYPKVFIWFLLGFPVSSTRHSISNSFCGCERWSQFFTRYYPKIKLQIVLSILQLARNCSRASMLPGKKIINDKFILVLRSPWKYYAALVIFLEKNIFTISGLLSVCS